MTDRAMVRDDPECDGTDAAHPAWWRGEHDGAMGVIRCVNEWLDGKIGGTPSAVEMQRLKLRITSLRDAAISAGARQCDAQVGVEDHGYRCRKWAGHKGPHRDAEVEWT
jgi:hypothetical protein